MSELYTIICRDKADTKPARMAGLKEHLAHMDEVFDRVYARPTADLTAQRAQALREAGR